MVKRHRWIKLPLRLSRRATVIIAFIFFLLLLIAVIWTQRRPIVADYIRGELERRGVHATYRVTRVGPGIGRIENVVIGNPGRPDLVVKWLEIRMVWGLSGPKLSLVKARGVRLYGKIEGRKLYLGEVDKLLPRPTGKPFEFPDLNIDLADAVMMLGAKAGRLTVAVEGKGNLAKSFDGKIAAKASRLMIGGCAVDGMTAFAKVAIVNQQPKLQGPLRARRLLCRDAGIDLANPVLNITTEASRALDSWKGGVTLLAPGARAGGLVSAHTSLRGRYAVSFGKGSFSLVANASAKGVGDGGRAIQPVTNALSAVAGTPVGPIGGALATAVRRASSDFDAIASLRLAYGPGYGGLRVERLSAISRSGARLGLESGEGLTYYWAGGRVRANGEFSLAGGGFPAIRARFMQPRGAAFMQGEATVAPFASGNARIALAPIRFGAEQGGATYIETAAVLSGPFNDGHIRNLSFPIEGAFKKGGFVFGEHCIIASFESLRAANLSLGRARLPLCPVGRALVWKNENGPVQGSADIRSMQLAGKLGETPITLASGRTRFDLADQSFTSSSIQARLGQADSVNRLDLDRVTGSFNARGVAGALMGGAGKVANVPLLFSNARGEWSMNGGDFAMNGSLMVADEVDPSRFYPLVSNDFRLTLADNEIKAGGWLSDPETGMRITQVAIDHSLDTGNGRAVLDVPGVKFDPEGYQPEKLTRMTTGAVALVDGTVTGAGQISWNEQGVTSTGAFSTEGMNLAAPFGPVEGLTTTINFTDLLGLVSAPDQLVKVNLIRSGINVFDGVVRYQALPQSHIRVESGRWPFMGGELALDETILDFSQPSTKKLVFRVQGLDAATFIQQMEFANINAVGTFDGVVPMEFSQSGGRIVDGYLVARAPGGNLSYIGIVSEQTLGTYGKLAFDALKSLRYDKFEIKLDGSIDGEFLVSIELDGIGRNASPSRGITGYIMDQLAKLRLEFNISMRGPFRALIGTARSFSDPSLLIQPALPKEFQGQPSKVRQLPKTESLKQPEEDTTTIQRKESEGVQ
jgi:hypothetical protein